jgi:hypothetical protein
MRLKRAVSPRLPRRVGPVRGFECEDDPEAARALLDAAAGWLRERGRDGIVGPMDFTTNDEIGMLIAGYGPGLPGSDAGLAQRSRYGSVIVGGRRGRDCPH